MIFIDLLRRSQRISSLQDLLWISSKCLQKIFIKFLSRTFNKNRFEIKYFLRSSKDLQLKSFRDPWESSKKIIPLFLIISKKNRIGCISDSTGKISWRSSFKYFWDLLKISTRFILKIIRFEHRFLVCISVNIEIHVTFSLSFLLHSLSSIILIKLGLWKNKKIFCFFCIHYSIAKRRKNPKNLQ